MPENPATQLGALIALSWSMIEVGRVLVLDDDHRLLKVVERALRRNGFDVTVAEGEDAIQVATQNRPDVAIVDRCMGSVDGLDVIRSLKSLYGCSIQTMMLSSADEHEMRMEAFEAGADDFLAKPVDLSELARKVAVASRLNRAILSAENARWKAEALHLYSLEAAALLAHDLNNGLTVALCNLRELTSDEFGEQSSEHKEMLTSALHAVQRMAVLTANFVDLGRFEDGVVSPQPKSIDLSKLVIDTARFYSLGVRDSDFKMEIHCDKGVVADLDPVLVERILHNLLGNATRYVFPGGRISVSLTLVPSDRGSTLVRIDICNQGPSIPRSLQQHIFEKHVTGNDGGSVRGLGLYFCKLACEAHNGCISVASDADITRFRIELPLGTPGRRRAGTPS